MQTPQPTVDRAWRLYGRAEEGLQAPEGTGTPQEDQQSQLTWTLGGSQRLNHQPKSIHGLDLVLPCICSKCPAWSSCDSPNNWSGGGSGAGCSLTLFPNCRSCSCNWAALSGFYGRRCAQSSSDLMSQHRLVPRKASPFSEEKGKWDRGGGCEGRQGAMGM